MANITDQELFGQVAKHRDDIAHLAKGKEALKVTATELRAVIAYTNTDYAQPWVDQKDIFIPQGYAYFNHSWRKTTELGSFKVYDPWVDRDPQNASRIISVHIKVEAFARLFARSWIGAELAVTIVPLAALESFPAALQDRGLDL